MARSRSGTRGRRGPRKPQRREGGGFTPVSVAEPRDRSAVVLPSTITVKELSEVLAVNAADVIRELIKSGIFATINQLIDRDTASLVAGELGFEVAEVVVPSSAGETPSGDEPVDEATKEVLFEQDDAALLETRAP
ncbi:MAG TPA: translation initiation factor IF-2 N-terminal domain-containing protein, partial [Verrucomicrobiae bacterium]|nr:translation initiation factor IF-2 N-terminal domain-containing protein [Verrucomicrobiae bacterium]